MNTPPAVIRCCSIAVILLASSAGLQAVEPSAAKSVVHDLTPLHDATRVLVNPHKGWYHHFPDNHPNKYQIARDADLLEFPGMDHLYIRLAWAYLEPKEGQFDWAVIDRIIEKWTAHGLGIAFRISCKETSTDRIEQQFATPRWVMEAGAQGRLLPDGQGHRAGGTVGTSVRRPHLPGQAGPVPGRLRGALRWQAVAALRGHRQHRRLGRGPLLGRQPQGLCPSPCGKQHVDLHLKHFKRAQLVISDDYVHALNDPAERARLHQHILTNGISYRDDSIMVDGYFAGTSDRFTVRSPEFFADAYLPDADGVRVGALRQGETLGNWDGSSRLARRPSSARARKARTSSAARSSCCTRPTSATTAMRTSG